MLHLLKRNKGGGAEAQTAREALIRAQIQRAKVDIAFDSAESTLSGLAANVAEVNANTLVLDLFGVERPGGLAGKRINAFFRVRDGGAHALSCMFSARIVEAVQGAVGTVRIVLPLPVRLDHAQRRKSLRLRPRAEWFEGIRFWRGQTPEGSPFADKADMGRGDRLRLGDISAGGLRLYVARAFARERDFDPVLGERLTFHLHFAQEMRNQPQEVWLAGRVVRCLQDPVDRSLDLGVEFERSGTVRQPGGPVTWTEAAENVVQDLAERLFAWHTVLFRERGE